VVAEMNREPQVIYRRRRAYGYCFFGCVTRVLDSPKPSESRTATNQALKNDKPQKPTPAPTRPRTSKAAFTLMNNISYGGGSRITYYPRASVGQCQADCAANASCRTFTWISREHITPGLSDVLFNGVRQRTSFASLLYLGH